jgi:arylsulfatase A-like enzyme
MAPAQATEPRRALKAASLLAVLIVAKVIALIDHPVLLSLWVPFAFFWQDVFVAAVFAVVEWAAPVAIARALYVAIAGYVALNVPITLVLGSPLTWTMWRAARGAMSDSAVQELTPANVAAVAAVLVTAALAPRAFRRATWQRPGPGMLTAVVAFIAIGIAGTAHVDTGGRHRNAIGALAPLTAPALEAAVMERDLRGSPFPSPAGDDLTRLRGSAKGMNVVVIVLESAAAQYLQTYGASADPMPTVSAIARQSIQFESAYAVYPESIKALFATLCAQAPIFNAPAEVDAAMPCRSVATTLGRSGYRTGLFHSGRFDYLGMRDVVTNRGFDTVEDAGAIGGVVHSSFGVDEETTVSRTLQWIDAGGRKPFFLMYLPIAGHHPYPTREPGPFKGTTAFTQYLNALHEADLAVAQLVDGLRWRGLDEHTMLVVYGDHGEAFGQHDGNTGHSLFIYDENVRVPLAIRVPGQAASRVSRPVSIVDLAPTLLELLGTATTAGEHVSMLDPAPRLAFFFTDYSRGWAGLRDGCRKYLLDIDANRAHLFDVCTDPGETVDGSAAEPDRVSAYRTRVLQWLVAGQAAATRSARAPSGLS